MNTYDYLDWNDALVMSAAHAARWRGIQGEPEKVARLLEAISMDEEHPHRSELIDAAATELARSIQQADTGAAS